MKNYEKQYNSPLGALTIQSDGEFLTGVSFESTKNIDNIPGTDIQVLEQTVSWLDIYFSGGIPDFTPQIRLNVTPFCKEVCDILLTVPYGQTMTYGEIANIIATRRGIPRMSAQAVGCAVHRNPIAIIIPCHRVIGSDNSLTGYAAGIKRKAELLKLEKAVMEKLE